jgi:dTDP-4-amino-4,6-dideoxygalactose transaminase
MTFASTVNVILLAGATPVLADIDPVTMNIEPQSVRRRITPRTRALLPVHFAGRPCEMDPLMDIAREHGLRVIEDCAHAIETEYRGRKAGTFGDLGCFSFYVTKNVATGEGGMVITADAGLADDVRIRSLHGLSRDAWKRFSDEGFKHYSVVSLGYKYNMMDLQAAIGIHQLARVEDNWLRRKAVWDRYQQAFASTPLDLPAEPPADTRHAYHLYTPRVNEGACGFSRDDFLNAMTAQGIGVGVHYLSIPEHRYYQETLGWRPEDTPAAMNLGRETVSLPLSARLTDEDVEDVIEAVRRVLRG